jgi:hypothetical protein
MGDKIEISENFRRNFKNREFIKKLLSLETGEEVRAVLKENGVELTPQELEKFAEVLVLAIEKGESLTDDDLQFAVGGIAFNAQGSQGLEALFSELTPNVISPLYKDSSIKKGWIFTKNKIANS